MAPLYRRHSRTRLRQGQYLSVSGIGGIRMDERVAAVVQLLRQSPRTRLRDLAAVACLSPSRLQHIFAAHLKLSIRAFSQQELLSRGVHLLTATDLSVKEIHSLLGFADASAFCRAFKKLYGVGPRSFRRTPRQPRAQSTFAESPLELDPRPTPGRMRVPTYKRPR